MPELGPYGSVRGARGNSRPYREHGADGQILSKLTQSRRWMFRRIFGLDGGEGYRKLRLEPLCCPHRLSRGTAPHEREYPRRKDRF